MTQESGPVYEDPITGQLLAWIQGTVSRIVASTVGLVEPQLRTPVAASGWTIVGLVGHVRDSSTFWLDNIVGGVPTSMDDEPWDNDPTVPAEDVISQLTSEAERACTALQGIRHDAAPGWWPEGAWGGYRQTTVRGVLLHLFNDNAAHAGQLDMAREGIDGGVWDFAINGVRVP